MFFGNLSRFHFIEDIFKENQGFRCLKWKSLEIYIKKTLGYSSGKICLLFPSKFQESSLQP